MSASFSEPFVLSTYSSIQKLLKGYQNHVYATHSILHNNPDGLATITAQGDGVHVFELSSLHSIASRSLGPATSFTCPSISNVIQSGGDKKCYTYAVIASSSELSAEEYDRTIWSWSQTLSGSVSEEGTTRRLSSLAPDPISKLVPLDGGVIVLSRYCSMTFLKAENNEQEPVWSPPDKTQNLIEIFEFPIQDCEFISSPQDHSGKVLIFFSSAKPSSEIRIFLFLAQNSAIHQLGQCVLSLNCDIQAIVSVTCNKTGHITVLESNGTWTLHQLELKGEPSIRTVRSIKLSGALLSISNASVLGLSSSHVLLAAPSQKTSELYFSIWDLQFSVVLASYILPLPASLAELPKSSLGLKWSPTSNSHALLTISPVSSPSNLKRDQNQGRSSIIVVPYACPSFSTLSNAIGRAPQSERWIDQGSSKLENSKKLHPTQTKLFEVMRMAVEQNKPQVAATAFFEWETKDKNNLPKGSFAYSNEFLCMTLEIVLQPSKEGNVMYSSEIVKHLLGRRLVNSDMVNGGLLSALRQRNDWSSIELALQRVHDLTESEIVDTLKCVLDKAYPPGPDAMEIDQDSVPALPHFLHVLLCHPANSSSSSAFRLAIKQQLVQPNQILEIIQIMENWLNRLATKDISLIAPKVPEAVGTSISSFTPIHGDIPPISRMLLFLTTLLDASFLLLLPSSRTAKVLKRLQDQLEHHSKIIEVSQGLKGALEPFIALMQTKDGEISSEDWRQKRKRAHELAVTDVGVYRYEEITL